MPAETAFPPEIAAPPGMATRAVVAGTRHVVSAGHYLAAEAGFQVLEGGGNAIDAAVAAALVLGVVCSDQVGVAGVAPMIIWMAERGELVAIDGLGHWPAAATCEFFQREHGGAIPLGLLRTVVPAAPDAFITALARYGTMSFEEVAAYAIRFARDGFVMYPFLASQLGLHEARTRTVPSNAEIFMPGGRTPRPGELFVQADLGRSLQYMVDQETAAKKHGRTAGLRAARDAFYCGDLMRMIIRFHAENGGLLTESDMTRFQVRVEPTVSTSFAGLEVHSCGFWCQGPTLLQALNIVEGLDLVGLGHNSVGYVHHIAEALKLSLADREAYYGDPLHIEVAADLLLSKAYAAERRAHIRSDVAWPGLPAPGHIPGRQADVVLHPVWASDGPLGPSRDTSYACVLDRWGNAVSITPSDPSTDTVIIPGTGLAPSSRGSQSRADPRHPACIAPGKRPRLTPNPALAIERGRRVIPFGSPGGDSQVQGMLQVLLNMTVFGMDPQTAIESPRFITYSHPDSFAPNIAHPGRLCLEGRFPQETGTALEGLGHAIQWWPDYLWRAGGVCLIDADGETGVFGAGADPRRAAAYAVGW
ncbi:gamma-glutamyltransferase family protein [Methylobacterium sp. A49B]